MGLKWLRRVTTLEPVPTTGRNKHGPSRDKGIVTSIVRNVQHSRLTKTRESEGLTAPENFRSAPVAES